MRRLLINCDICGKKLKEEEVNTLEINKENIIKENKEMLDYCENCTTIIKEEIIKLAKNNEDKNNFNM